MRLKWTVIVLPVILLFLVLGIVFFSLLTEAWFNVFTVSTHANIIVHRGLHNEFPENSLESVILAVDNGFDQIEVDVHQTSDSVLILNHDFTIVHPELGEMKISELSWDELSEIKLTGGIHLPTLQSVLESVPDNVKMILELKAGNSVYPNIEEHLIELVERYDVHPQIAVHSFNDEVLLNLHQLDSSLELHKLLVAYLPSLNLMIDEGLHFKPLSDYDFVQGLSINFMFANRDFIERAKQQSQQVRVWNLAPGQLAWNLSVMGVDGIITDRPLEMRQLFDRSENK